MRGTNDIRFAREDERNVVSARVSVVPVSGHSHFSKFIEKLHIIRHCLYYLTEGIPSILNYTD